MDKSVSVADAQHNSAQTKKYLKLRFALEGKFLYLVGKLFPRFCAETPRFDCLSIFLSSADKQTVSLPFTKTLRAF